MQISLDAEQVQLLVAVEQGRVHADPRFTKPDFERIPDPPFGNRRAGRRLDPLKRFRLIELVDGSEADRFGVRLYKLTALGEQILAEVREQETAARAEATS